MRCRIKIQKRLCNHKTSATFLQRVSLVCSIEYRYSLIHSIATFRYTVSLLFEFFLWKIRNFSVLWGHQQNPVWVFYKNIKNPLKSMGGYHHLLPWAQNFLVNILRLRSGTEFTDKFRTHIITLPWRAAILFKEINPKKHFTLHRYPEISLFLFIASGLMQSPLGWW